MRYLLLLAFVCSPAFACLHSAGSTDTYVEVCKSSDTCRVIFYDELCCGNNHTKRAEQIRAGMQSFLNSTVSLNDPEFDLDPDAAVDPDCENFYWGDLAGEKKISLEATHLVARDCIIENVFWDGIDRYIFTIRRADRCQ
jgi:hypothetical protein